MKRELKFKVYEGKELLGIERVRDGMWEWMAYSTNPDNGGERWWPGVFPKGIYKRCQFTGTTDGNRTEIFEDDIIECEYIPDLPSTKSLSSLVWRGKVEYFPTHTHFSVMSKDGHSYSVGYSGSAIKRWRVIGNINSNPELL